MRRPVTELIDALRQSAERAKREWPEVYCVPEELAEEAADVLEELMPVKEVKRDA